MKPPALSVTITLQEHGTGWHYIARRRGEPVVCSDGETFDHPGKALAACFAEIKARVLNEREGGENE
jgi:hypothetical protein